MPPVPGRPNFIVIMRRWLEKEIPRSWVRATWLALGGLFCLLLGFSIAGLRQLAQDLPPLSSIQTIEPSRKTLVLAANGDTIHEFFRENRAVLPLSQLPKRLQQAVIATEDRRFYDHYGVDARRLIKIIFDNLASRGRPGASTLTMQLARNIFLTSEMSQKTISRKIKEIILALQIEQTYTKDEILTMYLNQIYMGIGSCGAAYGMQSAARTYFGKDVSACSDGELTLLAGMIQNPGRYSPYAHLEAAYRRRAVVLQAMVETGALTPEEAAEIGRQRVTLADPDEARLGADFAAYFCEEVRQHLERTYGVEALYEKGLRVTTTLVPDYQRWLERSAEGHLLACERDFHYRHTRARHAQQALRGEQPERPLYVQCAGLLMDVRTGAIQALLGGRSFQDSKFDRALQARRQPGSVIKPFVYLTAIQRGYSPASILMDSPVVVETPSGPWRPHNYSGKFEGPVSLRYALNRSINAPTVKFYLDFGLDPVLENIRRLGVTSELPRVPSLFLGAGEVTLQEVVAAFAAFANQGIHVEPYLIQRVESADGEVLEEARVEQREAIDPAVAYIMASLLQSALKQGTGAPARRYGFTGVAGGKTGTTNDYTDAWFVGFTPAQCAGVWVGYDAKVSLGARKTGAVMALPIWAGLMANVAGGGEEPFPRPPGVVEALVCAHTGLLARTRCDSVRTEVFLAGQAPTRGCDRHGGALQEYRPLPAEEPAGELPDAEAPDAEAPVADPRRAGR